MDRRSVLLLSVLSITTYATPAVERCSHMPQTFTDPRTYLTHPCHYVCDYRTPALSPMDCHELCPDLYDCLMGITRTKPVPVAAAQAMRLVDQPPPTEGTSTLQEQLTTRVELEASPTVAQGKKPEDWTLYIVCLSAISLAGCVLVVSVVICVRRKCAQTKGSNTEKGSDVERSSCIEKTAEVKHPSHNGVAEHNSPWVNVHKNIAMSV